MASSPFILAIVGTYRKGGMTDQAVEALLASLRSGGAQVRKVYLTDLKLRYCTNCRSCTQQAGAAPGACVLDDDMTALVADIVKADGFVFASPMNAGTVTAVMKTFIERLICFAYWPWGSGAPKSRHASIAKRAVFITSSAAPAVMTRVTGDVARLMKTAAKMCGAQVSGSLFIGMAAQQKEPVLPERLKSKAAALAGRLMA